MYTYQNIILFYGYIFSYILSSKITKLTKIESSSDILLGKVVIYFNCSIL